MLNGAGKRSSWFANPSGKQVSPHRQVVKPQDFHSCIREFESHWGDQVKTSDIKGH